jgi:hypothetical protein
MSAVDVGRLHDKMSAVMIRILYYIDNTNVDIEWCDWST